MFITEEDCVIKSKATMLRNLRPSVQSSKIYFSNFNFKVQNEHSCDLFFFV